jgi:hypothetical protein
MDWLVEDPWPIVWFAAAGVGLLAVAFYHTRSKVVLAAIGLVLVGALGGLAVEWLVVTEREEVEDTLYGAAAALEANDPPQVLQFIASDATEMRAAVQRTLPQFEIGEAKIGDLKINFNRMMEPPTATAQFIGRITAKTRSEAERLPRENFIRPFEITLRREGDRWLLSDYKMDVSVDDLP